MRFGIVHLLMLVPLFSGLGSYMAMAQPLIKITETSPGAFDASESVAGISRSRFSISFRDTDINEALSMLAKKSRVNIILSKEVNGDLSLDLYDVTLDQAVRSIAKSTGYEVEKKYGSYFILPISQATENLSRGVTVLKTYKIQYSDTASVQAIINNHLSKHGKVTTLKGRNLIVVEDTPAVIRRITGLVRELDKKPRQILIEAKILEIALNDGETFGLDWNRLFSINGDQGLLGTQGFSSPGSSGFFLNLVTPKMEVALSALNGEGRVRTLSTPKLLALENQEASVVIGDRIGYRLTTTVNQVTSESIEFLESGVILKVTPYVDSDNKILLDIHPEVSTGSVLDGIPSQTTTEVTTQLLVNDGQTVFIGGLIKQSISESQDGVPVLGAIPLIGNLFQRNEQSSVNTETIVMITPYIVNSDIQSLMHDEYSRVEQNRLLLRSRMKELDRNLSKRYDDQGKPVMVTAGNKSGDVQKLDGWWAEDDAIW
ncbi:MAG: hypothetical protein OEZ38_06815 [Gammaproteobacteria bacterium]|nr:hypothetical protein [Gammaproteobacteria bacterium]